jgi:hypothetical protein
VNFIARAIRTLKGLMTPISIEKQLLLGWLCLRSDIDDDTDMGLNSMLPEDIPLRLRRNDILE